jgi:hypothetical protein
VEREQLRQRAGGGAIHELDPRRNGHADGRRQRAPHRAKIANGAAVSAPIPITGRPSGNPTPTIEPINAVVTAYTKDLYVPNGNPDIPGYVDCGPQVSSQNYDAASRVASRTVTLSVTNTDPACAEVGPDDSNTPSYAYDAEDHTTTIGDVNFGITSSLKWSPSGHAYSVTYNGNTYGVHYDGDRILFISNANGTMATAKIETLANYTPAGGLVVVDRGVSRDYVSEHNGSFYGGVSIGSSIYKDLQNQTTGSIPYIFYGSTNDTLCHRSPAGCAPAANMEYDRVEGFEFFGLTIQGARATQSASSQWTTPDAFAGTAHDPMSQKSFMWDNNNAYAYSDPTGFQAQRVDTANADGSALMQTNGGAQPSVEVASAGPFNSSNGMEADINNAIVVAYGYETAATTGSGKFKPGEMADIVANHLSGTGIGRGYDVSVTKGNGSAQVSVRDPQSPLLTAQVTIKGGTTEVAMSFRGSVLPGYGISYRWLGALSYAKGSLDYHRGPWPADKWAPAIFMGPYPRGPR